MNKTIAAETLILKVDTINQHIGKVMENAFTKLKVPVNAVSYLY